MFFSAILLTAALGVASATTTPAATTCSPPVWSSGLLVIQHMIPRNLNLEWVPVERAFMNIHRHEGFPTLPLTAFLAGVSAGLSTGPVTAHIEDLFGDSTILNVRDDAEQIRVAGAGGINFTIDYHQYLYE
ncbi:hypothetical protein C8F04DRAFT_1227892 [Mycena alexandri]|uniref:Uncharacterized protein n=1 Tax=Mycena alexandri TaxID=1745969 RepID=A0AAD6XHW0_9AGAR|nr:hypothetical protein C8F04DRAFT_1227892 [Mycena alexandri]